MLRQKLIGSIFLLNNNNRSHHHARLLSSSVIAPIVVNSSNNINNVASKAKKSNIIVESKSLLEEIASPLKKLTTNELVKNSSATNNNNNTLLFDSLNKKLQAGLKLQNISNLFEVQSATLTAARSGNDLLVRAKTGSGKTLAFALPILEKMLESKKSGGGNNKKSSPKCIVLTPTREICIQVHREFEKLSKDVTSVAVYGGAAAYAQIRKLESADVIIGTPGRVNDLLDRGALKLNQVQIAVLDEADEMLNVGFLAQVKQIYSAMPSKENRQTLLFSATVSKEVQKLMDAFLKTPKYVDLIGNDATKLPSAVKIFGVPIKNAHKNEALVQILQHHLANKANTKRALVFTSTKRSCDRLVDFLREETKVVAHALHGGLEQPKRERVLQNFRRGALQVIVATDVASRGLDISEVDLVVNYDLPESETELVHRSGRTGRAYREGKCLLMFNPQTEQDVMAQFAREVLKSSKPGACFFPLMSVPGSTAFSLISGAAQVQTYRVAVKENVSAYLKNLGVVPHRLVRLAGGDYLMDLEVKQSEAVVVDDKHIVKVEDALNEALLVDGDSNRRRSYPFFAKRGGGARRFRNKNNY